MADDGSGFDWIDNLMSQPFSVFAPLGNEVVEEGMRNNNWVAEGMGNNLVEEGGMGKKGGESMVGAAGSDSQISPSGMRDQASLAVKLGSKETASGGSKEGAFTIGMVESAVAHEAPQAQGMVNLGVAPPGARRSKRPRSASGSIGTTGGGNEPVAMGSNALLDELWALANVGGGSDLPDEGRVGKRLCANDPDGNWWDTVSRPAYPDADFKRHFHMSRSTFEALCNMLDASVRREDTASRDAIPVPKRVAVCIYRLASGEKIVDLKERFGIARSTVHRFIHTVIDAINDIVGPWSLFALWPHGAAAMAAAAAKFEALTGELPGVIGAVYTTHVPVIEPKKDATHYYNCRLAERPNVSYGVPLHAAVNADGAFTDLFLGKPGAMSDEQMFFQMSNTHMGEMVAQGKRLVGGEGYPLTDWTLVPYTHGNLTQAQNNFNEKVALARGVAFDAFRRLKARWAILQMRGFAANMEGFKSMMGACCVLHNFCESNGDELGDELKGFELEDHEMVLDNQVRSAAAAEVRDAIARNLLHGSTMAAPTTSK